MEENKDITKIVNPTLTGDTVANCGVSTNCVLYSEGEESNLVVPQGYVCNSNTLVMSEGDITITPDVTRQGEGIEGCIFLAKNDIIIQEGDRQSTLPEVSDYVVGYDYIEGFLISNNQINILRTNPDPLVIDISDGLEIHGGIVSMGSNSVGDSGISLNRTLRLYSYFNPTMVVEWDVRYTKLSVEFFGPEAGMYKQEVGFKVY
jgi:hypothetical protein